jgi:hypothetical protein
MKKLLLLVSLYVSFVAFAQEPHPIKEKVAAARIAYITEKLDLTPETAQKFWPLFNELESKRKGYRSQMKKLGTITVG